MVPQPCVHDGRVWSRDQAMQSERDRVESRAPHDFCFKGAFGGWSLFCPRYLASTGSIMPSCIRMRPRMCHTDAPARAVGKQGRAYPGPINIQVTSRPLVDGASTALMRSSSTRTCYTETRKLGAGQSGIRIGISGRTTPERPHPRRTWAEGSIGQRSAGSEQQGGRLAESQTKYNNKWMMRLQGVE